LVDPILRQTEESPLLHKFNRIRGIPDDRFMQARGMYHLQKSRQGRAARADIVPRETRSYELAYVNALWHFYLHEGKRRVATANREYKRPHLFGLLDDCSRVCCHAQWYLDDESTENLVRGLSRGSRSGGCRTVSTAIGEVQ
jgi:hypothetical protein